MESKNVMNVRDAWTSVAIDDDAAVRAASSDTGAGDLSAPASFEAAAADGSDASDASDAVGDLASSARTAARGWRISGRTATIAGAATPPLPPTPTSAAAALPSAAGSDAGAKVTEQSRSS